jgi:hypothetical protein
MTFGGMVARVVLAGALVAQLADAATFTLGVAIHGIGIESNGVAAGLYQVGGLSGVLLAKGAAIVATVLLLMGTATRFPRLLVWGSAAATSLGLLGVLTNVASMAVLGS